MSVESMNGKVEQQETEPVAPDGFDLDALERQGAAAAPFKFIHKGRQYTMLDPQEIDWQDLIQGLRNPALFVRFAMPIDQQRDFFTSRIEAWKMNALMEQYQKHYGLPDLGNASALRS